MSNNKKLKLKLKKKGIVLIDPNKKSKKIYNKRNIHPSHNKINTIPWIEKYRPKKISNLLVNEDIFLKINQIIKTKEMPNIIITGVPGIGKTTTIQCIVKDLLGKYCDIGVLELNASDARGIKAVHESIVYFCKKKVSIIDTDKIYAKHKIIILDEADNMTKKAQQLINNLMEKYYNTTRFAFTCNTSSDIIEAIQSRCIILRYQRLSNEMVAKRLIDICKLEKISYTEDGINAIVSTANGDMRHAINNLQLTYYGYKTIIPETVKQLCDKPNPELIKKIFMACIEKDLKYALTQLNILFNKGYSNSDISLNMINTLKNMKINEFIKMKFMNELSQTAIVISKGVNTQLQLTGCIAMLCRCVKNMSQ